MARYQNASPLIASMILLLLMIGATAPGLFAQIPCESPREAIALQTPGLGTINVTVVDNAGRPMAGATVKLNGTAANITDANGTCSIIDLAPNEIGSPYSVSSSKLNYLDSETNATDVVANETTNVTLMIRGGWIVGTVLSSTVAISGANVTIAGLGYVAGTDPMNGSYFFEGIPSGSFTVIASAQGYVSESQNIEVPLAGIAFAYFVLGTQNGSISGRTLHYGISTPLNATNVSVQIGQVTVTVQSDSDGNYNITNVPEGTYTVTAAKDGFYPASVTDVEVTRGNRTLVQDIFLTEKPTRLYGVVRSGQVLLVGANISLMGTGIYALSGADGNYQINVTAGTYVVSAVVQGYETQTIPDVLISPGSDAQLNFNMTGLPGARLRGVVKDSRTATPLANVLVTIDVEPQPRSVFTNINGEFEFPALAADNYTLRFEKSGYRPLEITKVQVVDGLSDVIEFQMTPLRDTFNGFIKGLDMAHSMMVLALALTFIILGVAIFLRVRMIVSPATAPAVYDQGEEEKEAEEGSGTKEGEPGPASPDDDPKSKKIRKLK